MPAPEQARYGRVARTLHWLMVVALAVQFVVGYAMEMFDDLLDGVVDRWLGGEDDRLLVLHAALGVTILLLALVLVSGEDWDLGAREWHAPREWLDDDVLLGAHVATHLVFFAALLAHVGLVLKHQFVDRDGLLRRML